MRKSLIAAAFAVGAILGFAIDTARAGTITDGQTETIGFIAVEAVAIQRCGVGQRIDMFDGLAKNGMTIDDIASKDGKFAYVTMVTMQHAQARYDDHPAQFCAFVKSKRAK